MKRSVPAALLLCLSLAGCAAAPDTPQGSSAPAPVPLEPAVTYEVTDTVYEDTVTAEDGTVLKTLSLHLPQLTAYHGQERIDVPATAAQEAAAQRAETFNQQFAHWTDPAALEESAAEVREVYQDFPEHFTGEYAMPYSEELTYTVYRTGSLISIAADYYSYFGGAHPNTVYLSWNFDLEGGAFLTVPELSRDPQALTLAVADMIEAQARQRFEDPQGEFGGAAMEDVYFEDYRKTMEQWDSGAAVDFDADGINVTFSAYDLAPYAAGPQFFHFTYRELDGFWSESGRTLLGLDAPGRETFPTGTFYEDTGGELTVRESRGSYTVDFGISKLVYLEHCAAVFDPADNTLSFSGESEAGEVSAQIRPLGTDLQLTLTVSPFEQLPAGSTLTYAPAA